MIVDNQEDWYGHKFKKINDTTWKCDCGEKIYSCIPEGYVLVPIEPTYEMLCAGAEVGRSGVDDTCETMYKAMIAAAQDETE